ncbi:MAG: IMP dehydrogenase [candidate division Zixibacteria bacterium]|nr:IMP dehydrogenase [candidate division Zixibacteria bacterium]
MARVLSTVSHSLKEYRLLPRCTRADGTPQHVSLETRLCRHKGDYMKLRTPFTSAAMQAVTSVEMAVAMAQLGGMGVFPVSQTIEAQCTGVDRVKRFKAGFQTDIVTLSPDRLIGDVVKMMDANGYSTFPVTDTGLFHGKLVGIITDKDFDVRYDREYRVADRMKTDIQVGVDIDDLKTANQLMIKYGRGFLPIVSSEGTLLSVVFKKDLDKHIRHPHATIDSGKRLRVGAAISTHPEDRERLQALVEHHADVIVIDASDGFTEYQQETIAWAKSHFDTPVIAGNIVTAEGFRYLAEAGADAVKIGMGIGSGCTTQQVKGTGRGQATAILEVAEARDRMAQDTGVYLPLIADGGLRGPADMIMALALGADTLMMGNLLARFAESQGEVMRNVHGELVKEYWMEGSKKAHNARRYAQSSELFFEEGIVGQVPYAGSVYDKLPLIAQMIKSGMATAGCRTIDELHRDAHVELQSPVALQDAGVHGITPTQSTLEV